MSAAYVDSSCLVAVLLGEPAGVPAGETLGRYDRLFASNLLDAEVSSAARRERVALLRPQCSRTSSGCCPAVRSARRSTRRWRPAISAARISGTSPALYLRADIPELEFLTLDGAQDQVAAALGFPTPLLVK